MKLIGMEKSEKQNDKLNVEIGERKEDKGKIREKDSGFIHSMSKQHSTPHHSFIFIITRPVENDLKLTNSIPIFCGLVV